MRWLMWAALAVMAAVAFPAGAAPPLEAYGRLPAIANVRLSPSGDRFALVFSDKAERKLLVATADQKPLAITSLDGADVLDLMWAGDDHLLVFTSTTLLSRIGGEPQKILRAFHLDLKTGKAGALFNSSEFYVSGIFGLYGAVEREGRWSVFAGAAPLSRAGRYATLYEVDLTTGRSELVDDVGDAPKRWAIGPEGAVVGHSTYQPSDKTWRLFAGLDETHPLMERAVEGERSVTLLGPGRKPGTLLIDDWTTDEDRIIEIMPGRSDGEVLLKGETHIAPLFDPRTRLLVGIVLGESGVVFYDAELERRFKATVKAFPGLRVKLISFADGFRRLVVFTDGPGDAGTYWLVDIATGSAKVVGEVRPTIRPADVGPTRRVEYQAADGLALDGVLTLPPGPEPTSAALVVLPHDGPLGVADEVEFDWVAQAFASRGYVVFQPNYRGTLRRGDAVRLAAAGELGRKMQTDLSDGVAALVAQGLVDPKRVCIVGRDYGGYAALAGVTLQQGVYRCAVSVGGWSSVASLVSEYGPNSDRDKRALQFWRYVSGAAGAEEAKALSPVNFADRADAPVLLIHAADDTQTSTWESRNMERALRRAAKPVEFVVLKDDDHWLLRDETRQQMLTAAVAFVEKHNPAR